MKSKNTPPVILLNMAVSVINERENDVIISQYASRVSDSGAVPMLIPSIEKEQNIETLLDFADGVLFIGGKDYDPQYYGEELHPMTATDRLRPHFDIAFGLCHTIEKSAEIAVKIRSMQPMRRQTMTRPMFEALAKAFNLKLAEKFLR